MSTFVAVQEAWHQAEADIAEAKRQAACYRSQLQQLGHAYESVMASNKRLTARLRRQDTILTRVSSKSAFVRRELKELM